MMGVIADDLTGAAELGGVGRRFGLRTEILLGGAPGPEAELVCVDTDSRMKDALRAADRATAAAKALALAKPRWIYKKVDSVLRGQVTAELEALMEQCRVPLALLVPANPSLGRVIRDGQYFVKGKLIHETEFARDPAHPRRSSAALSLLGPPRKFPMCVRRSNEALPNDGIVLGEAETTADLRAWVARRGAKMLLAGGAEFFACLLAADLKRVRGKRAVNGKASTLAQKCRVTGMRNAELFVCGSTSESSREFVAEAKQRGTPAFALPTKLGSGARFSKSLCAAIAADVAAAFESNSRVILHVGLSRVVDVSRAGKLSGYLVQLAEQVLRQVPVQEVYAEGGATAAELVRQMGWKRFEVVREIAPGVTALRPVGASSVVLTIKPGTYVWPKEIADADSGMTTRVSSRKTLMKH